MRKITSKDIGAALRTSSPIIVTFVVLGIGYGILMQKHGYGPVWSLLSGIIIFSGTAQFVSVTMLSSGSVLMAGITALMISARHLFFSISMIGRYSGEGRRKGYLYYALCDETYAMLSKDDGPEGVNVSNYRLLVTIFDQCAWVAGSFLGGWIGTLLTFDSTGIDFAMTALFTTVFIQQWIDNKNHLPAVLGVGATLACRLIFGRDIFLIPAMIIIIAVLTAARSRIEPEGVAGNSGNGSPAGGESHD
ncbi:MAG: AzlC family ABC transporter permease [Mogibacterium sp.]|nr:AzlC family ABC transporter permease [Mogibacterium sp.]